MKAWTDKEAGRCSDHLPVFADIAFEATVRERRNTESGSKQGFDFPWIAQEPSKKMPWGIVAAPSSTFSV